MERICTVILSLLLAVPAFGQFQIGERAFNYTPAGPVPGIKQSALSTADGTYTATFASGHTAGGLTCVHALLNTLTTPTISNTAGWSWGSPVSYTADGSGTSYAMWTWCTATLADASSDTITVSSGAFHGGLVAVDISNASAIDNSQGNGAVATGTVTTGSFSLTGSVDMVFAVTKGSGGSMSIPSGYTSLTASGTGYWGVDQYQSVSYKVVTGSSVTVTWGGSASNWDAFGVAVK